MPESEIYFSEAAICRKIPEISQKISRNFGLRNSETQSPKKKKFHTLVGPCLAAGDRISCDNYKRIPKKGFAIMRRLIGLSETRR